MRKSGHLIAGCCLKPSTVTGRARALRWLVRWRNGRLVASALESDYAIIP